MIAQSPPKKSVNVKLDLVFTTTKLLSYMIFVATIPVAVYLKSHEVFVDGILTAAALQGVKSAGESLIARQKAKSASTTPETINNVTIEES